MEIGILFLGGAKRVSVARHLMHTAKTMGHEARIYSYELSQLVPVAEVAEVITGLRWSDPDILNHLATVVSEKRIKIVLPFVDPAIEIAASLKEKCPDLFVPVSPAWLCRAMFDKSEADRLFRQNDIPVPGLGTPSGPFPQIWKPRTGSASKGILIVRDLSQLPLTDETNYLIQEYISDAEEYTVDCYVSQRGEALSIVPRKRIETAGGEAVSTETVKDDRLIALSEHILTSFPFRGPVTLQFLVTPDGRRLLMEINPRLGGGVVASIAAGSGILKMLLEESMGIRAERKDDWNPGTLVVRYLQEVVFQNRNLKS